jgi:hypothetical protein
VTRTPKKKHHQISLDGSAVVTPLKIGYEGQPGDRSSRVMHKFKFMSNRANIEQFMPQGIKGPKRLLQKAAMDNWNAVKLKNPRPTPAIDHRSKSISVRTALPLSSTWPHQQGVFYPDPQSSEHTEIILAKADKSIQSGEPRSVPDMHILIDVVCASTARSTPSPPKKASSKLYETQRPASTSARTPPPQCLRLPACCAAGNDPHPVCLAASSQQRRRRRSHLALWPLSLYPPLPLCPSVPLSLCPSIPLYLAG